MARLPGGTVESQKEFIESLSNNDLRRNFDRHSKIPPVANQFALGYTYYDLLDADHEGKLVGLLLRKGGVVLICHRYSRAHFDVPSHQPVAVIRSPDQAASDAAVDTEYRPRRASRLVGTLVMGPPAQRVDAAAAHSTVVATRRE